VLRLVLDTSTAISGLLWQGTPSRLIDAARAGAVELCGSAPLLAELQGVLTREKFAAQLGRRQLAVADIFGGYTALLTLVTPASIMPTIAADPSDDMVLATALAARADLIVSGDKAHLLALGRYRGISVVVAAEALRRIAA
jgi:putative PIN family toxin of toxin-antitoxin system